MLERKLRCPPNYCRRKNHITTNTLHHLATLAAMVMTVSWRSRINKNDNHKQTHFTRTKLFGLNKNAYIHQIKIYNNPNHTSQKKKPNTDYTSFGHDELVEFAQPHEIAGYAPEPPIPYLPVDVAYDNHYPVVPPHAHAQYGPPPLYDSPHSHITNYISTDRKGKTFHKWKKKTHNNQLNTREAIKAKNVRYKTELIAVRHINLMKYKTRSLMHWINWKWTQNKLINTI